MELWINLKFGDGDFERGFTNIQLQIDDFYNQNNFIELETQLPPGKEILDSYELWKEAYELLAVNSRGFKKNQVKKISADACLEYARDLQAKLNQWLLPIKSEVESVISLENLDNDPNICLVVNTGGVASESTKNILHRIPWQEFNLFLENSQSEAALCFKDSSVSQVREVTASVDQTFRRIKIINIFGDSRNIDTSKDEKLIIDLEKRGAETICIKEPTREELDRLWDEPCDILFFAGHSESKYNGEKGIIHLNENESLSLEEIPRTLKSAISKGLKLAIFNSCDGLGLAQRLADFNLPYVVVWREVVPDEIAHKFLKFFLSSYSKGDSLIKAFRKARGKLQELTQNSQSHNKLLPGVSWLPIICKNTLELPPSWEELGGLSAKLPESPYQGLSAFGEEDADFFFGREKFVDELKTSLLTKSLVAVVGASGSGKSSVVFAGLVPHLRKQSNVEIISFRPGKNPFGNLAIAINHHFHPLNSSEVENTGDRQRRLDQMTLEIDLREHETELTQYINDITTNITTKKLVLIADQFEELYTLVPQKEQQYFLNALIYAINYAPRFTLVLTLRADFYAYALSNRDFSDVLGKGIYNLAPMNREELRSAVEKPAQKLKVKLERGLTDALIKDLGNQPGGLPLLEFTLTQLWEKPRKGFLTHEAYQEIGGLEKALANYADTVLDKLSQYDQKRAEKLFIQLVHPGEGTDDTRKVATSQEVKEKNWDLVKKLADERLVVTGIDEGSENHQKTVEIIHEALIREWGTFRQWIQDNREFRSWQEKLKQDVSEWEKNNQELEDLLQGARLAVASDWYKLRADELTPQQQYFIAASIKRRKQEQQKRKRRRRLTISGLICGFLIALILAAAAWWQWQNAYINQIKAINVSSQALLKSEQNFEGLIQSLSASTKLEQTPSFLVFNKLKEKTNIQKQVDIGLQEALYKVNQRNQLSKHTSEVKDVSFSPDGKTIATASDDSTVKIWSLDGKKITTLSGHQGVVNKVRFSPEGKTIATASWDGTVKLWQPDGELIITLKGKKKPDSVYGLSFNPDGKTIVTADIKGIVRIWTINGKLIKTFKAHDMPILKLSFNANGNILATSSEDSTVKLWTPDGTEIATLGRHKDGIWSVSFSPDNQKIATASKDGTVKIWSIEGNFITDLDVNQNSVTSVSFSPDGKQIATAGADNVVKIWSAEGKELQILRGHKDWIWSLNFSPDGETIATASKDGTAKLWQLKGKKYQIQQAHSDKILSVSFSSDKEEFATASMDGTVKLWKRNGELIKTLKLDNMEFTHVSFSPDEKIIAAATTNGNVVFWNRKGEKIKDFKAHQKWIWQVSFSPDSKTFATAGNDGTVKLWNREGGNLIKSIEAHTEGGVNSVSFSPDDKILATAGWDETVKLWSLKGKLIKTLEEHKDGIHSVTFSADGKMIATASEDKTAKLWTRKGKLIANLEGHEAGVFDVKFSPNGKTIATASFDKTVKLWSIKGKEITTYKGHDAKVYSLDFSDDGRTLASTDGAGKLILWNLGLDSKHLLDDGCNWVGDYLKNNPNVNKSDRALCNNIGNL
ncbi:MAG: CHAT domain-containing protein [Rivularia sp. (in: cyanobacteria)]